MQTQKTFLPFVTRHKEIYLVGFFSLLAAVHVLVYSAAFPFFANTDEHFHFDLIVKYSHLQIPKQPGLVSGESLQYMALFSSWEYLYTNDLLSAPPWKLSVSEMTPILLRREIIWRMVNNESGQPPLYYLAAGGWWRLCSALGFHDGFLLYLPRFFNALVLIGLVWLAWLIPRQIFPENIFIRTAVPALIAFLPQSIFYTLNNDVFSPLCFGVAFLCLMKFFCAEIPSRLLAIATGLALAATFLTKTSNLPLLGVSAILIVLKSRRLFRENHLPESGQSLALLFFTAVLPMAAWMSWCKIYFGHFMGSALLPQQLGWTVKPFFEWWRHPVFTPSGFMTFLSGNLATFWQGEMMWYGKSISLHPINLFYTILSVLLIAFALLQMKKTTAHQRLWLLFALAAIAAEFAFFGFLSIIYDFHNCYYPSREYPYFASGRLLLGTLIPFFLLVAYGFDRALDKLGDSAKFAMLATLILVMCLLETITDWQVFGSQYNWYNM